MVDAAWSAGLKNVVETELEHALFGDIARSSQMAMLASQGLQTMERRRFQDAVMWIDRAEANFLEYVESVPERRRNAAFEDDRRQRMAHLSAIRTAAKLGCGDFDAAYAAAQNTLEYYQRRCAEMGDEPAIDDFAGTLTKRGKMLGLVVGTRLQIASVEWHRSGRDAALKQVAQAEVLVREFEIKDASAEAKICAASPLAAASLFYAYADKNGRRDPAQAMVLAKRAYDLGGDQMGLALDAMACASAANGNFEEAIEWARRGDELITGVPNKWLTQARIQRFKNRQLPIDEFVVPTATADAPDSRRR